MVKHALKNEKMKFGEWRPIGVCDSGATNEKQAKMFNRKDYLVITAPHVTRENWRSQPDVIKVILKYAKDVASKSTMTKNMKCPKVKEIKLVGTILHYKKTPTLSNESKDGRLQLFQVEYEDKGKKRSWKLPALVGILSIILVGVGTLVFIKISRPKKQISYRVPFQSISYCDAERSVSQYDMDLSEAQQQLNRYLRTVLDDPYDPSTAFCFEEGYAIVKKEETLLRCYNRLKKTSVSGSRHTSLRKVRTCVQNICQKGGQQFMRICRGR